MLKIISQQILKIYHEALHLIAENWPGKAVTILAFKSNNVIEHKHQQTNTVFKICHSFHQGVISNEAVSLKNNRGIDE
jgi:hypothetical protein